MLNTDDIEATAKAAGKWQEKVEGETFTVILDGDEFVYLISGFAVDRHQFGLLRDFAHRGDERSPGFKGVEAKSLECA
jgi:hypothetical protein